MLQQDNNSGFTVVCNEKLIRSWEREKYLEKRHQQIVSDVNQLMLDKEYDFIEVLKAYGDAEVIENLVHAVGLRTVQKTLNMVKTSLNLCACHDEPMKYKSICSVDDNPTGERQILGLNDCPIDIGDC